METENDREQIQSQARNAFWRVGKEGFVRLIEHAPSVWNGSEQRFYRAEKEVIAEHVSPLCWGAVVFGVLLFTFRISGSRWFIQMRDGLHKGLAPSATQQPKAQAEKQWTNYLNRQTNQTQATHQESSSLPFDMFISFICGCSPVVILSNRSKLTNDFAQAPLVPGKSLIYTHMCQDMTDAYNRLDPKAFHGTEDSVLLTFQSFVTNCQRRAAFIADREAKGEKLPDRVPFPGLSGLTR